MDVEVQEWTGQEVQGSDSYPVTSGKHLATLEKNLNRGHILLHIVSLAHEVWLICNSDIRS